MDKGRRNELTKLKLKRRLKNLRLDGKTGNFYAFKSHGKPCSCWACRDEKYRNKDRAKGKLIQFAEINQLFAENGKLA